jgi:CheY-like chemotaxis protein
VSPARSRCILVLEDNAERVQRFAAVLKRLAPDARMHVWRSARFMIREVEPLLPDACLLSLDHDLDPEEGVPEDAGTGWEVTQFLATLPPTCPVIVHTSNSERARWMAGEFDSSGWHHVRVAPIGDDWIERDWHHAVRQLLRQIPNL